MKSLICNLARYFCIHYCLLSLSPDPWPHVMLSRIYWFFFVELKQTVSVESWPLTQIIKRGSIVNVFVMTSAKLYWKQCQITFCIVRSLIVSSKGHANEWSMNIKESVNILTYVFAALNDTLDDTRSQIIYFPLPGWLFRSRRQDPFGVNQNETFPHNPTTNSFIQPFVYSYTFYSSTTDAW